MTDSVELKAVDSFHTTQTGTVPAGAEFQTHSAHADELIKRGLAVERGERKAPEPDNKMSAEPANKSDKPAKGHK